MWEWLRKYFGLTRPLPVLSVDSLPRATWWRGDKFPGGFGPTTTPIPDYWELRARSHQLFETNLYARGTIRRLVTNIINTGLHLESVPDESLLGMEEDALSDWSEHVENRFRVWEKTPWLCDHRELRSFGALQATALIEALVEGDVLAVMRQHPTTGLPRVQLISGSAVQTPMGAERELTNGNRIVHGVELDRFDRHVAYWIRQRDPERAYGWVSKRLPAWGEKTGRRLAWLVYGTERRLDDVRGMPLLALMLQSLRDIDRYRDAALRKAVVNSILAMFIKKNADKVSSLPMSGKATRREVITETDGATRTFALAEHIPGVVLEELQVGEEPHAFGAEGTDVRFGDFEKSIVAAFSWGLEVPPEILMLSFNSNYSASQAAINEFKMFLNRFRTGWGEEFCGPIYEEWLLSEALLQKISAPGLLEAWRDATGYDVYCAWTASEWAGQIKPAVDLSKLVKGYIELIGAGLITRDRACRELTGMKFSKVVKRLRIENEQLAAALAGLPQKAANDNTGAQGDDELLEALRNVESMLETLLEAA